MKHQHQQIANYLERSFADCHWLNIKQKHVTLT